MKKMSWDYIAGFYEGEGTCGFYTRGGKRPKEFQLQCCIAQKQKDILIKIFKFIGYGGLYKDGNGFRITFTHKTARKFLNKILPYCRHIYKVKQIKKALRLDKKYINAR